MDSVSTLIDAMWMKLEVSPRLGLKVQARANDQGWETVKTHLWKILNAVQLSATSAFAESIKASACRCRNRSTLRTAIVFHKAMLLLMSARISEVQPTLNLEATFMIMTR